MAGAVQKLLCLTNKQEVEVKRCRDGGPGGRYAAGKVGKTGESKGRND